MPILLYIKIRFKVSHINGLKVFTIGKLFTDESNIVTRFDVTVDMTGIRQFLHLKFDNFT